MAKIGIIGGSFDPIHFGHLITAQSVLDQMHLDKILFIPAGHNPFKNKQAKEHRFHCYEMVKKAIEDNPKFEVSDVEIKRSGRSYTYNTLRQIIQKDRHNKYYFIIGSDLIYELDKWYRAKDLFKMVSFIVMDRANHDKNLKRQIDYLRRRYHVDIKFCPVPQVDISSTMIRNKLLLGKSIRYLTKPSVIKYINKNKLYKPTKKMENKIEFYKTKLKPLIPEKRYEHSLNVMKTAVKLAEKYNEDIEKALVAGLLHDCAKGFTFQDLKDLAKKENFKIPKNTLDHPSTLHAPMGQVVAKKEFGVDDPEILSAIAKHTTGDKEMSTLDKIIFLADYIEPGRKTPGVDEIRELAAQDLDLAVLTAMNNTINYLTKQGRPINPITITARNELRKQINES